MIFALQAFAVAFAMRDNGGAVWSNIEIGFEFICECSYNYNRLACHFAGEEIAHPRHIINAAYGLPCFPENFLLL